jgi:glycerophosphoryl diester phosphodiesterase
MQQNRPIVIAHRGASAYLPEHSLAAKVLAHGYGADYLEQDVILSRDDVPLVFHDLYLDELTDVAARFPGRARADGRHYAIDFSLAELKQLRLHERIDPLTGQPAWPKRFQEPGVPFSIVTLDEELALVRGLNATTGRFAGIYTEVKSPAWHHAQGKDSTRAILDTLTRHGYTRRNQGAFLQCFDDVELKRVRHELHWT